MFLYTHTSTMCETHKERCLLINTPDCTNRIRSFPLISLSIKQKILELQQNQYFNKMCSCFL